MRALTRRFVYTDAMADADATSLSDEDFHALEQALNANSRGRAFLGAHAARARALDDDALQAAIADLKRAVEEISARSDTEEMALPLQAVLERLHCLRKRNGERSVGQTGSSESQPKSADPWRKINAMTEKEKLALFS
jgi:hypothetical protein